MTLGALAAVTALALHAFAFLVPSSRLAPSRLPPSLPPWRRPQVVAAAAALRRMGTWSRNQPAASRLRLGSGAPNEESAAASKAFLEAFQVGTVVQGVVSKNTVAGLWANINVSSGSEAKVYVRVPKQTRLLEKATKLKRGTPVALVIEAVDPETEKKRMRVSCVLQDENATIEAWRAPRQPVEDFEVGATVKGIFLEHNGKRSFVDVGAKRPAVLPFPLPENIRFFEELPGLRVTEAGPTRFRVDSDDLPRAEAKKAKKAKEAKEAKEAKKAEELKASAAFKAFLEAFQVGTVVQGVVSKNTRKGLWANINVSSGSEAKVYVRVPTQTRLLEKATKLKRGTPVALVIEAVDPETEKKRMRVSCVLQDENATIEAWQAPRQPVEDFEVGATVKGIFLEHKGNRSFVDVGAKRPAVLPFRLSENISLFEELPGLRVTEAGPWHFFVDSDDLPRAKAKEAKEPEEE